MESTPPALTEMLLHRDSFAGLVDLVLLGACGFWVTLALPLAVVVDVLVPLLVGVLDACASLLNLAPAASVRVVVVGNL